MDSVLMDPTKGYGSHKGTLQADKLPVYLSTACSEKEQATCPHGWSDPQRDPTGGQVACVLVHGMQRKGTGNMSARVVRRMEPPKGFCTNGSHEWILY
jgi:hypothetical protein